MATYEMTELYLLNVPLENDYLHTLYFADKSAQTKYFKSKVVLKETDFSYQRKDSVIRYPAEYDDLLKCNYVMYRNTAYGDKWFYAFITKLEYISEGMTKIFIETDVMQTWLDDYEVKASFIEREHTRNDAIGANTVPENLETGPYICNNVNTLDAFTDHSYVIGCTVDLNAVDLNGGDRLINCGGNEYNGIYSGVKYYVMEKTQLNEVITLLANKGKSEAITCIFCCPPSSKFCTATVGANNYAEINPSDKPFTFYWGDSNFPTATEPAKPKALNGHTPKNKKLLTYPYTYMLMSNNAGGSAIYRYEMFTEDPDNCPFRVQSAITPGFSIRLVPMRYNGAKYNLNEGLNLGKLPICNWQSDVYTNWLVQNNGNIGMSLISGIGTIAGSAILASTGAGALAIAGTALAGASQIANSMATVYQHSFEPAQAQGNINSGDVTMSADELSFTAYQMTIKAEYARMIDEYFTAYGYKTNRIKVPESNHRRYFWYTKCISVNIDSKKDKGIPAEDMQKIKNCYNTGITFWKDPSKIQNYSVTNSII